MKDIEIFSNDLTKKAFKSIALFNETYLRGEPPKHYFDLSLFSPDSIGLDHYQGVSKEEAVKVIYYAENAIRNSNPKEAYFVRFRLDLDNEFGVYNSDHIRVSTTNNLEEAYWLCDQFQEAHEAHKANLRLEEEISEFNQKLQKDFPGTPYGVGKGAEGSEYPYEVLEYPGGLGGCWDLEEAKLVASWQSENWLKEKEESREVEEDIKRLQSLLEEMNEKYPHVTLTLKIHRAW